MNTDIDNGSCTPNHHGMIDPDETLGMTAHQVRAAAIDWGQAPPWAGQYKARYNHLHGKTEATWSGRGVRYENGIRVGGEELRTEPAPVFFDMGPSERGMVVTFGESQGAKALLPKVTVRKTLVEAGPGPGELSVDDVARLIDWTQAPDWATAWAALGRSDGLDAYWIAGNDSHDQSEVAPDFGVKLGRGRTIGVERDYVPAEKEGA